MIASSFRSELLEMFMTLAFVLGLAFFSLWFLKRFMRSRGQAINKSSNIKVLERRTLNQKSSLYLVDILGKAIVIAESPSGIQLITEFPPETDLEALLAQENEKQNPKVPFKDILQGKLSKFMQTKPQ